MKRFIAFIVLLFTSVLTFAQTDTIRYVRTSGDFKNDGLSWATAMNNVQDAINDLREYLARNNLPGGSVYIAEGTYVPTESTESSGGSMLNTSFKIYEGIHVYGGFCEASPEARPGLRKMENDKTFDDNWNSRLQIGAATDQQVAEHWHLKYKTILSGNHSPVNVTFTFDSIRGRFNTTFPANSYHVVWFATNGEIPVINDSLAHHYLPLERKAWVDGCTIRGGNASARQTGSRTHTGYGGGVYMVENSGLYYCEISHCSATMRGGGVYMDGGGTIEFCYIHTCQASGVGIVQGYGGAVCIDYNGSVGHSYLTQSTARIGAGLAICHVPGEYPWRERIRARYGREPVAEDEINHFSPFCTASVISNNTSNAEGGGIYLDEGGTLNHCSVLSNSCIGPDVMYYGRRHGRSGGVYIRNCGLIYNSVFWGSKCRANNDLQFAAIRQDPESNDEILAYHSAFMNHDITDWTGVQKDMVFSLERSNMPHEGIHANYPCFHHPTPKAGVLTYNEDGDEDYPNLHPEAYQHVRQWHPGIFSALAEKGVQVTDAMQGASQWIQHAHTSYGVVGNTFEPVSSLGALIRENEHVRYALIVPQALEYRKGDHTPIPTIFVDPNRIGLFDEEGDYIIPAHTGDSWDAPVRNIGDAIMFLRQNLVEEPYNPIGSRAHYHLPSAWDEDGNPTAYTDYNYVQILVKEGEMSTAGPNNYLGNEMRTASIRMLSHLRLYGGYPASLSGTSTEGRDPMNLAPKITANILGAVGHDAYDNNAAHVLTYVNAEYAIVDGFKLYNGNAHRLTATNAIEAGGGVIVNNETTDAAQRIDMVGNELRNCRLANNSAPKGAAIYVNGEHKKRQGFVQQVCYAELTIINCIIRNNTADYLSDAPHHVTESHGVITANGRAFIDMDHCDVVNNVGYPFKADNKTTRSNIEMPYHGFIRVDNSLVFCNGDEIMDNRDTLGTVAHVLSVNRDGQDYVFGTYNMFDADLRLHNEDASQPHGFFKDGFTHPSIAGVLPTGMPDAANHPLNLVMPASLEQKQNKCIFTRVDRNDPNYPVFLNPARNVGHSYESDKPLFGGNISYMPLNVNPCVNAASVSEYGGNDIPRSDIEDYDLSDTHRRNYGGEPDVGAIENTNLPVAGSVLYVTPYGAGRRDGSAWDHAIAGNSVYRLDDVAGPPLAVGDQIDAESNRVLDSEGNPILTTNDKYSGGWGRMWLTTKTETGVRRLTRQITTINKCVYVGGARNGEESDISDPSYNEITSAVESDHEVPADFVPGYEYSFAHPYGEISGASRSFWRANPYHSGTDWNNASGYSKETFIAACNANGWICNTRSERYVGGLQFAVEQASRTNKTLHADSVQVWVGAGTYNDYKGFVMRDSVTVLGGFPTEKYQAPGLTERQALMSNVINIPKSLTAEDLNAEDYETILQISDENPYQSASAINTSAVKYWDDDYSAEVTVDMDVTQVEEVLRKHQKVWTGQDQTEVTTTYIRYPDMYNSANKKNVFHKDNRHKTDYTAPAGPSGGTGNSGLTWNDGDNYVYQYYGDQAGGNRSWELVYQNITDNVKYSGWSFDSSRDVLKSDGETAGTVPRGMALEGFMSKMSVWQTMKNVPADSYRLDIDLGAYYTSYPSDTNTGITFYIIASDGDTLAEQQIFCNADKLRRYHFTFEQPEDGDLTIRIISAPGSKNATPTNSANNRKVSMANVHLYQISNFAYLDGDMIETSRVVSKTEDITAGSGIYTSVNHRTTLRKRVLTMPDVCVPTYGAGTVGNPAGDRGSLQDALAHTHRVSGPTKDKRTSWENLSYVKEDPNYIEYNEANWDGFTIRYGFIIDENMAHGGGAGVNMYEGAHLRNSIVVNNSTYCARIKGGGIFCDGSTSTIEGCFVLNNNVNQGNTSRPSERDQVFAGGMFLYEGTCFNSLFANNSSYGSAGGLGFCVGRFFNNTVAYNTCSLNEGGNISGGAISLAIASSPNLFVANTIIYGNSGIAIRDRNTAYGNVNPFLHCYVQSAVAQPNDATNRNVGNYGTQTSGKNNYGIGNNYLNGVAASAENTPFAADFVNGVYTPGNAAATNDFRLRESTICVNHGSENFEDDFYTALHQKGQSKEQIESSPVYQSVQASVLPRNDVAFANRVQDCQIDIGAYEFDGASLIKPDTTTHPGIAIFYVAFEGVGNASGDSKDNAACGVKMQQIIDAAGRYKHALMTESRYNKGTAGIYEANQPNKHWIVQLRMAGDSIDSRSASSTPMVYTATRSTKHSVPGYADNPLDYSFIIPHGVQILGGYSLDYYHYELDGEVVPDGTAGAVLVDERDPLTFRTILSGKTHSPTGADGNAYHVLTFTNDLFAPNQKLYTDIVDGNRVQLTDQLAFMTDEKDRTVVDGVFIEDGFANSSDAEDRSGAAAIVQGYVHIRNCIVQNNEALNSGGGLYLKPGALVSGSIIRGNTASIGGGIYVEQPQGDSPAYARVFTSTICHNTASVRAGGLWFDKNVRVNSSVLWKNESNDFANVAGQFTSAEIAANADYPFMFSGVEVRKIEGSGNVELSATETEGVRWDRKDIFNEMLYYPIEMSSTLARAGMTYNEWRTFTQHYPTLDSTDIAGVSRLTWNTAGVNRPYYWADTLSIKDNDFIEIGARAVNRTFLIEPDMSRAMYRLFVVHTELLESNAARALQDNTNTDENSLMYRQMGSSFLNPFHRLGDAFTYIMTLRKKDASYRNKRFEVFLGQGEYVPYRNAFGEEDHVHTNTFAIPEGVTVIGGLDHRATGHNYCQAGYYDRYTMIGEGPIGGEMDLEVTTSEGTFTLNNASTLQIQNDRTMEDYNKNSVIEPWEFEKRSILTGNTVDNDEPTHVYHVITCYADSTQLGPLPFKYRNYDRISGRLYNAIGTKDVKHFAEECEQSKGARSIIIDGVTVQGGYANHIDSADYNGHAYNKKTYFRGGGIFVDGNWTQDFEELDYTIPNVTDPADHNILLVIRNCEFKDNMAGNGGAIYSNGDLHIHTSHFAQNYSQGPMSLLDQSLIPWTAGGCIATNAICGVANCLFDNNEAKRGRYPITIDEFSDEYIEDSDVRQGFAGVISAARQSKVKAVNCHFVKNKAVAYPAIFNFRGNQIYSTADSMHLAFNCVFWGNEATGLDHINAPAEAKAIFNAKYNHQRDGVMQYEKAEFDRYNALYNRYLAMVEDNYLNPNIPDTLDALRELANRIEGIYFSAYEEGKGLGVAMPKPDAFVKHEGEMLREFRALPMPTKPDGTADVSNLFTRLMGNHNVYVSHDNDANSGLHFVQPSTITGVDGFEETADWVMARINPATDNGWGFFHQTVTRTVDWYEVYSPLNPTYISSHFTPTTEGRESAEAERNRLREGLVEGFELDTAAFVFPIYGVDSAALQSTGDVAMYNYYCRELNERFGTLLMPSGTEHYMRYTREGDSGTNEMYRISSYPKQGIDSVFIDMGIYEYQYIQLRLPGSEIDTMWVTTTPRADVVADGTTWERATDRLQDAIDWLMLSHNNHDKYVCLLGGTYTPQSLFDNCYTFRVAVPTDLMQLYLPEGAQNDKDYSIPSITFLGGWSTESQSEGRDVEKYPTILEMRDHVVPEAQNQLFVIGDMTRQFMQRTFRASDFRRDTTVIPVTFDGLTFVNPHAIQDLDDGENADKLTENGGGAIYYRFQRQYHDDGGMLAPDMDKPLYPRQEILTGVQKITLPKLTISNCIFMDNGRRTVTSEHRASAVRIDQGGGDALIVNSLFHSNAGAPIFAPVPANAAKLTAVPNRVRIINSTFALNDGHLTLDYGGSELHNSLIWMDDLGADTLTQFTIGATSYNSGSSISASDSITNNAIYGLFDSDDTWFNESLTAVNKDVYTGPNFVNPDLTAANSEQRRARDFRLNPAVRTMNMADTALYKRKVFAQQYSPRNPEAYWQRAVGLHHPVSHIATDNDLAMKSRLHGKGMERGAYECQALLQRVLYVQPTKPASMAGDGSSWQKSFGQGQLQNAIDVASVYSYLNRNVGSLEDRRAFVFVKGSYDFDPEEQIIARDGVSLFGSLPGKFNDTIYLNAENEFDNFECVRFVRQVRAQRTEVASLDATPTRVKSVTTTGESFNTGFTMDGFIIDGNGELTDYSPVVINNDSMSMRNCIITNCRTTGVPVVNLNHGIIYNSLVYDNDADVAVRVGPQGLLLNATVVNDIDEGVAIDSTNSRNGNIRNCIAVDSADSRAMFAPYLTDGNAYTLPTHLITNRALTYQLHEQSRQINAAVAADELPSQFAMYVLSGFVDYNVDRDILGNPRRIGGAVDNGAYETWRVTKNQAAILTSLTNSMLDEYDIRDAMTYHRNTERMNAFTDNFGGNKYPHAGSVVYLMDSSVMSIAYGDGHEEDFAGMILRPSFLLMKPGSSLYGNGHMVQVNYLAAEKRLSRQRYAMMAFPFDYFTSNITSTSYNSATDALTQHLEPLDFQSFVYNGVARSAKDYVFRTDSSALWLPVDTAHRVVNEGYLADFGSDQDTVLRVNAFAATLGKYIYTEEDEDKYVTLHQYDNRASGSGVDMNFTRQEDMGWNMKGLPWLISNYRTDTIIESGNYLRQMHMPHVFYTMNADGAYTTKGDNIYSARSWDRGETLSFGNAFLLQTATPRESEELTFHLPYYGMNEKASRPLMLVSSRKHTGDIVAVMPDSTASTHVQYTYGRDGVKWLEKDSSVQVYLLDHHRLARFSLLGAAPVETDIPLGVVVPEQDRITFSLPDTDAFADYRYVWLIDYAKRTYTNLLQDSYTVDLPAGTCDSRFALRIGGYPSTDKQGNRRYDIYVIGEMLYVGGLIAGDNVTVVAPTGQIVTRATVDGPNFRTPLPIVSGYVVKVNDFTQKVLR